MFENDGLIIPGKRIAALTCVLAWGAWFQGWFLFY